MISKERRIIEYKDKGIIKQCTVFDKISDKTEAYIVGIMWADAGFGLSKSKYPRMTMNSSNEWLVKAFNDFFIAGKFRKRTRDISITNSQGNEYRYENSVSYEYCLPSRSTLGLISTGIVALKPDRDIINLSDEFIFQVILGFFDGDGSIVVLRRKDCRTPRLNIHIVSGAFNALNFIQKELNVFGISSSIYSRSEKCKELRINNTEHAIKFCEMIYKDLPDFYDKKKKKVFNEYMIECLSY